MVFFFLIYLIYTFHLHITPILIIIFLFILFLFILILIYLFIYSHSKTVSLKNRNYKKIVIYFTSERTTGTEKKKVKMENTEIQEEIRPFSTVEDTCTVYIKEDVKNESHGKLTYF